MSKIKSMYTLIKKYFIAKISLLSSEPVRKVLPIDCSMQGCHEPSICKKHNKVKCVKWGKLLCYKIQWQNLGK